MKVHATQFAAAAEPFLNPTRLYRSLPGPNVPGEPKLAEALSRELNLGEFKLSVE